MYYFRKKKILSVAQSLAYTTILSLVPILVIFFFVLGKIAKTEIKNDIMDFVSVYFFPEYVNSIFNELETLSQRSMPFCFIIGFNFLSTIFGFLQKNKDGFEVALPFL